MATFENSYAGETLPAIFYPENPSSMAAPMDYEGLSWEQLGVSNAMLEKEYKRSDSFLDLVASAAPKDRPVSSSSFDLNLVSSVYPAPPSNPTLEMKYYPSQPSSRNTSTSPPESQSYPAPPQDYFSACHHDHASSQLPPGENHICPATTHKLKRREQNRASQRAFRQRQITYVKGLELKLSKLTANYQSLHKKYEKLCREHSVTPSSPAEADEEDLDAPSESVDMDV